MKFKKHNFYFLVGFFSVCIFYFLFCIVLSKYFYYPIGAMTRIGNWSEKDYGETLKQKNVVVKKNGLHASKIYLLGDSFSKKNIWQSVFYEKSKQDIMTFHYGKVGCIDNWINWVINNKSTNTSVVIIQVVEQSFLPLFRTLQNCNQNIIPEPIMVKENELEHFTFKDKFKYNFDSYYLTKTLLNSIELNLNKKDIRNNGVSNVMISNKKLFSNNLSNRMLYLRSEEKKNEWEENELKLTLNKIEFLQDFLNKNKIKFHLMVIPDKSTQYSEFIVNNKKKFNIYEKLQESNINYIDLYNKFRQFINSGVVDLYRPSDNHLSFRGYEIMSEIIFKYLNKKNNF